MAYQRQFTYRSVVKGIDVAGYMWGPEEDEPRAIVVLVHGMTESMARYDAFARVLADRGFLVVGKDHLGHGKTAPNDEALGYFGPMTYENLQNADLKTLIDLTREQYPDLSLFIFGHSMGSFLTREFITEHGDDLAGVILSGPGDSPALIVSFARFLVDFLTLIFGPNHRSNLIQKMMFGQYNSRISPRRTAFDWLTRDDAIVDEYVAHKENGFVFTLNGFAHMLTNVARVTQKSAFSAPPSDLPLLIVGGSQDPVGEWGKAVPALSRKYQDAGLRDVSYKLYEGARHEVINELNRDEVIADILAWIEERIDD